MRESTFSKILFASFAFVALACAPKPAFAQHVGGGRGGGGGSHGGGGGGGHFPGGARGGGPSGGSSMGRSAAPRFGGRPSGSPGRPSGAPSLNSRSIQGGGGPAARPPQARISALAPRHAILEQAHRAAIPLPPMASGTPLLEREAQEARPAQRARHAHPATL